MFWETYRCNLLEILATFYESWQTSWRTTKFTLGELNLSESGVRRVNFYESEQKKAVISLLADLFLACEASDRPNFCHAILSLAKELRPSLPYVEYEPEENFNLSSAQLARLRDFLTGVSVSLKGLTSKLQSLDKPRPLGILNSFGIATNAPASVVGTITPTETSPEPLTKSTVESLLRERLGISFFDFIDFDSAETPAFNANGYYPELLQASTDFGF